MPKSLDLKDSHYTVARLRRWGINSLTRGDTQVIVPQRIAEIRSNAMSF